MLNKNAKTKWHSLDHADKEACCEMDFERLFAKVCFICRAEFQGHFHIFS